MMRKIKLHDQILLLANEDYSGLWEVYGEAMEIFGDIPKKELLNYARQVVLELFIKGWILLYWCREPLNNDRVFPVNSQEAEKVLQEDKYWDEPRKDSLSIRILATEEGEKAFKIIFLN
jgi:hypothetical protein